MAWSPTVTLAMHPGRCASVTVGDRAIGFVGELHPKWRQGYELAQAPVLFELALDAVLARLIPAFEPISKLQPVERDIAVIVPEQVTHAELLAAIDQAPTQGLLKQAVLFDVYRPTAGSTAMAADEKSLAVRLQLCSASDTLKEETIEAVVQAVVTHLQGALQARLRA